MNYILKFELHLGFDAHMERKKLEDKKRILFIAFYCVLENYLEVVRAA